MAYEAELAHMIQQLHLLERHPIDAVRRLFDPDRPTVLGRAPGRLDVMGGIADYSGSLVLQMPIAEATWVAVQSAPDDRVGIASLDRRDPKQSRYFDVPIAALGPGEAFETYDAARRYFVGHPDERWAAYVLGVLLVLLRRTGRQLTAGLRILIDSEVPEAKGVSSSAALEVAALHALAAALEVVLEPGELALWAHEAENRVAGAPCGVMDQLASACGRSGQLLRLLCQPAHIEGYVAVPPEIAFFGIDSGVRHAVSGSDYGTVRASAFMGSRILLGDGVDGAGACVDGASVETREFDGAIVETREPDGARGNSFGYLANVTPSRWMSGLRELVPVTINGREFLSRWGRHLDTVTAVEPDRWYALRAATEHPILEHHRCRLFHALLAGPVGHQRLAMLGELMYQSHASYSACGLGAEATDTIVRLVRELGPARGVFGARITGGGCGGTVAILARAEAISTIEALAERYLAETGRTPTIFSGSSSGALECPPVWLESRYVLQES